jgi:hypothetical protein
LVELRDAVQDFYQTDRADGAAWAQRTVQEVVEDFLMDKTSGKGVGWALLMNIKKPLTAKILVSHAWKEPFSEFVYNLERHRALIGDQPMWICFLSIFQHVEGDDSGLAISDYLGDDVEQGPFSQVLRNPDLVRMVVNQTSAKDAQIRSRLWCIWEMFLAVQLKIQVNIIGTWQFVTYGSTQVKEARCSKREDMRKITQKIEQSSGGWEAVQLAYDILVRDVAAGKAGSCGKGEVPIRTCSGDALKLLPDVRQSDPKSVRRSMEHADATLVLSSQIKCAEMLEAHATRAEEAVAPMLHAIEVGDAESLQGLIEDAKKKGVENHIIKLAEATLQGLQRGAPHMTQRAAASRLRAAGLENQSQAVIDVDCPDVGSSQRGQLSPPRTRQFWKCGSRGVRHNSSSESESATLRGLAVLEPLPGIKLGPKPALQRSFSSGSLTSSCRRGISSCGRGIAKVSSVVRGSSYAHVSQELRRE